MAGVLDVFFSSLLWSCSGKNQAMYTALSRTCHVTLKTLYDTYDVTKYSIHNDKWVRIGLMYFLIMYIVFRCMY